MTQRTLPEWMSYIESIHPSSIVMGLERTQEVRKALDLAPSFSLITVAGTNGKGSTCAFLEAMLDSAGYHTGTYTSPHLLCVNERVRIGAQNIGDAELCSALARVEVARGKVPLTYFEFMTLAAVVAFEANGIDVGILEVGMGGRLDAVNVFDTDCAIVTSIDLDHTEYLGSDRAAIAREKSAIFRSGRAAVCADPAPPAQIRQYANQIKANLQQVGREFGFVVRAEDWDYWQTGAERLTLPMPGMRGAFQFANASASITALRLLSEVLDVGVDDIKHGLRSAALAGRFEVLSGRPEVILDVAHNPHAAANLAAGLHARPCAGRTVAIFGAMADKDIAGVIGAISSEIDSWLVCDLASARAARSSRLKDEVERQANSPVQVFTSVAAACTHAFASSGPEDRLVVFGSFVTVTDAMLAWKSSRSEQVAANAQR